MKYKLPVKIGLGFVCLPDVKGREHQEKDGCNFEFNSIIYLKIYIFL